MRSSTLQLGFAVSLLVHGAIFSAVSIAGFGTGKIAPAVGSTHQNVLEITLLPVQVTTTEPEVFPVVTESRTKIRANAPVETTAPPMAATAAAPVVRQPTVFPSRLPINTEPAGTDPEAEPVKSEAVLADASPKAEETSEGQSSGLIESSGSAAGYLFNPKPHYPRQARRRGEEGDVVLNVLVSADGFPSQVKLEAGSGFDLLDRAALKAVRAWRFVPAQVGSNAVSSRVEVPVQFRLSKRHRG